MEQGEVLSEGLKEIPFVLMDIVCVAKIAEEVSSGTLCRQTVQCNRSVFLCPSDGVLGALAILTIHRACEMAVGRINLKPAGAAAGQETVFDTGFNQFEVRVSLRSFARFCFVIAGTLRLRRLGFRGIERLCSRFVDGGLSGRA